MKIEDDISIPDDKNRFNVLYQKVLNTRWHITIVTMAIMALVFIGIALCIAIGVKIAQEWKEMLMLMLGAFIVGYNRVIDYWFNSQHDDKMVEKIAAEGSIKKTDKQTTEDKNDNIQTNT